MCICLKTDYAEPTFVDFLGMYMFSLVKSLLMSFTIPLLNWVVVCLIMEF